MPSASVNLAVTCTEELLAEVVRGAEGSTETSGASSDLDCGLSPPSQGSASSSHASNLGAAVMCKRTKGAEAVGQLGEAIARELDSSPSSQPRALRAPSASLPRRVQHSYCIVISGSAVLSIVLRRS